MSSVLSDKPKGHRWALPDSLQVPPDRLQARLDFFSESIVLHVREGHTITNRVVSARDLTMGFLNEVQLMSGILPEGALWWSQTRQATEVALWRPPRIWPVALQMEPFKPAERLKAPMPGLVFVCRPGQAPLVFAAKRRPQGPEDMLYHAPLFNVDASGRSCAGTHTYPDNLADIPESFFVSFFTPHVAQARLSRRYGDDLLRVWREIDGRKRYPIGDLVKCCRVGDIMGRR
ncbi:MAG: hypothetical protein Q7R39_11850 [Dehalococcoidia bacterium]|nr:hypothetical protein [Dehalococcoidia bacterium]